MNLADLINRIRDDIEAGEQRAYELGVPQHERVDIRYVDVEALLRVAEALARHGHLYSTVADSVVERALVDGDGG